MSALAATLRALHTGPGLLVLPNAWDAASARAVAKAGFPAVATSSGAVARSLGYKDGEDMPADEAFAAVARIAGAVDVPRDGRHRGRLRAGPGGARPPAAQCGAVGCNVEDTDHHGDGVLVVAALQAPVNVYVRPEAPTLPRLAAIGVRRASFGSGLFHTTQQALREALAALAE